MAPRDMEKARAAVKLYRENAGNISECARILGITRRTFHDRLRGMDLGEKIEPQKPQAPPEQETASYRQAARVADLQAQTKRLVKQLVEAEDIRSGVLGLMSPPLKAKVLYTAPESAHGSRTVILHLSDLHAGEVISLEEMDGLNTFNLDIFRKRLAKVFSKAADLMTTYWKGDPPERVIVILGGDLITGEIHDELAKTNDALSAPAIRECAERLAGGIAALRAAVGCPIDVFSVPGNHGRLTKKPECKGMAKNSYDWLIGNFVEMMLKKDPGITFYHSTSGDATVDLYGRLFVITHGDRIGSRGGAGFVGPVATIARGFQKVYQSYSAKGRVPYKILIGHFHTTVQIPLGYSNGSLPGPSEYSRDLRSTAEPSSQNFIVVHSVRGVIDYKQIYPGSPEEGSIYRAPGQ